MFNLTRNLFLKSIYTSFYLLLSIFSNAFADGLESVTGLAEDIKDKILTWAPIICVIILICLAIAYMTGTMDKSSFWRWGIGVIIIGSASSITTLLMNGN